MRVLSPRMEPPVTFDDGSMHKTASLSGRKLEGSACSLLSFKSRMYDPNFSTNVDLPTPGGPAIPIRNEELLDGICFSLCSSMSAMRRLRVDLLSTSVIAFANAIRCIISPEEMARFLEASSFRNRMSAAKRSIVPTSSSVKHKEIDDDNLSNDGALGTILRYDFFLRTLHQAPPTPQQRCILHVRSCTVSN